MGGPGSGGPRIAGRGKALGRPRLREAVHRCGISDRVYPVTKERIDFLAWRMKMRRGRVLDLILAKTVGAPHYRGRLTKSDIVAAAGDLREAQKRRSIAGSPRRVALNASVEWRWKLELIACARNLGVSRGKLIDAIVSAVNRS